ncbi:ABC-type iron transport system FetAB, ATPase component [Roseospirillum parvum]|uniref:ABC-type iron transport system FetAB, ATPase component n=1 Tax=Roseospirillum parvum TaxID=83401 RepID=A0A1G8CXI4_9PROT|nr:ABC-type iron transport system FetAB, ATPase component [Roseospirillum parvum]
MRLRARGLTVGPGRFDLDLEGGEAVAVEGPSGAGKSRLLRALADLDPAPGAVSLNDTPRDRLSGPAWRRQVAYGAARPGWWAATVGAHFEDREAGARLAGRLGVGGDDATPVMDWPVSRLSEGESQRLALVRLLCREGGEWPAVLLLDEPTAALDPETTGLVEDLLAELVADGVALLFTTHNPAQAARLADRRLRLAEGRLTPADDEAAA